ncbi:MAG: hypothetical protein A2161_08870 [Candidatus Schekmanbacteria bacterium RBG_13_48_7]|uniref:Uncharacterized protein n=1 Tax=Candidatus Schekmanbacteria bacterium RBG_13_48_7 TaxID=1817878 RepID=A0A1F7RM08_9BACT|nr:MAG: hypothetical protein A2161_08870 [Candidatus Schekmanbacteria bacterium RBG_13_48_7]
MKGIEALKTNARFVDQRKVIAEKIADKISINGWILASEGYYDGIDIDSIKLIETDSQNLLEVYGCCTLGDYFVDVGKFNKIKTVFFQALLDIDANILSFKAV